MLYQKRFCAPDTWTCLPEDTTAMQLIALYHLSFFLILSHVIEISLP